jgi:hypothetical protein
MLDRRKFVQGSLGVAVLASWSQAPRAAPPAKPSFQLLYSNDLTNITSCVSPWHRRGEPFRPEMLEASVDEVADRGVDVHLLQPGLGWVSRSIGFSPRVGTTRGFARHRYRASLPGTKAPASRSISRLPTAAGKTSRAYASRPPPPSTTAG